MYIEEHSQGGYMKKNNQGFTLLEMTIVVIIISVIFLLSVPSIQKTLSVVNHKGCKAIEKVADAAILEYKMEYDEYPQSVDDLINVMAQNNYRLEMEKLSSNEGFMLVECCIVLVAISVMTLLVIPSHEFSRNNKYLFQSDYLYHQSTAIKEAKHITFQWDKIAVIFNENGNVNQAKTVDVNGKKIVIELGGGRLVEK